MNDAEPTSPSPTPEQDIVEIAAAILHGELGVIDGSRRLCRLQSLVFSRDHDPDFLPFVGIDSATDHLPIGDVRQHWAAEALLREDIEIREAEAFYRDRAFVGCARLLARFSSGSKDNSHNV